MEQYVYTFAGLRVQIESPVRLTVTDESKPFLQTGVSPEPADHKILLQPCKVLPSCSCQGVTIEASTYVRLPSGKGLVYHRLFPGEDPVVLVEDAPGETLVQYLPRGERWVRETFGLMNLLGLDDLLLRHDRLMLHSSFISWQGQGILFSAPSGTGKSTQAELWEKYQNARIINGDRAVLSRSDSLWYAHGLPFAGSSRIYQKESAPLALLVCLSQGKENTLDRLSPLDALRRLLPEVNLRRWDEDSVTKATGLLMELVTGVPVYHLSCRPEVEATNIVRALLSDGIF